jgi:hypothetical protein
LPHDKDLYYVYMTTTPHEIRNWLHQLLSSIEAAMPDVTAQCFSQQVTLEIATPFPNTAFTEWQPLADALNGYLEGLPPGAVRYRLIENVTLAGDTLPPEMPLPVEIQWRVALFRRGSDRLTYLNCTATLIREADDLAAIRFIALPPEPERSADPEEPIEVPEAVTVELVEPLPATEAEPDLTLIPEVLHQPKAEPLEPSEGQNQSE